MKFCGRQFNIYLVLAITAGLCGCASEGGQTKKQLSSIRIHLELSTYDPKSGETATIGPVSLHVDSEPFLTEVHVKSAKVIDTPGGYALQVKFGRLGGRLLEQYTTANHGRHMAIFSRYVEPPGKKLNDGRWIAAPWIQTRISDGLLTFTPATTREEAESIAKGLTDMGKKLDPETQW